MRLRSSIPMLALTAVFVAGALPASAGPKVPAARLAPVAGVADPVPAPPARAGFSISRTDGNDTKGALDLRSMKITRGRGKDTIVMTTFGGVSNRDIDPVNGNLAVLIDRNDNKRYDYAQYIFFAGGRIRGVLVDLPSGRPIDRTAPASRVNSRTFRTVITRSKVNSPGTYRFAVFGFNQDAPCTPRRPCIDGIPNRFPLIPLDHRAPTLTIQDLPRYSTEASADLTAPIDFSFHDDPFGTGVKRWTVQRQEVGGPGEWETVGTGTGTSVFDVPGEEGVTYDVRVSIIDKQKNDKVTAAERTTFPFDDRNSIVTYSDALRTLGSQPGSFLGTTTFLDQGETATIPFDGSGFCVIAHPTATTSTVTVVIDGGSTEVAHSSVDPRARTCFGFNAGSHTAVISGQTVEPFAFDGYFAIP